MNILCQIHCNPNQNQYVQLLSISESFNKYEGKYDVDQIATKIDLQYADNFYNNCRNAGLLFYENTTLYQLYGQNTSSQLLYTLFNYMSAHYVDFRFHNIEKNETFHLVPKAEDTPFFGEPEPIEDNGNLLPL